MVDNSAQHYGVMAFETSSAVQAQNVKPFRVFGHRHSLDEDDNSFNELRIKNLEHFLSSSSGTEFYDVALTSVIDGITSHNVQLCSCVLLGVGDDVAGEGCISNDIDVAFTVAVDWSGTQHLSSSVVRLRAEASGESSIAWD